MCYDTGMKQFRSTLYYVTEDGRVFSHHPVGGDNRYKRGRPTSNNFREVATGFPKGYRCVRPRGETGWAVHQMVMEVYGTPRPDDVHDWVINHIDEDRFNNSITNLEWLQRHENVSYSANLHNNRRLLSPQQEQELAQAFVPRKVTRKMLAKRYGISESTVKDILQRQAKAGEGA